MGTEATLRSELQDMNGKNQSLQERLEEFDKDQELIKAQMQSLKEKSQAEPVPTSSSSSTDPREAANGAGGALQQAGSMDAAKLAEANRSLQQQVETLNTELLELKRAPQPVGNDEHERRWENVQRGILEIRARTSSDNHESSSLVGATDEHPSSRGSSQAPGVRNIEPAVEGVWGLESAIHAIAMQEGGVHYERGFTPIPLAGHHLPPQRLQQGNQPAAIQELSNSLVIEEVARPERIIKPMSVVQPVAQVPHRKVITQGGNAVNVKIVAPTRGIA